MERFPPRLKMKTLFLGGRYVLICGRLELTRWLSLLFSVPDGQNPAGQTNGLEVNLG